MTDKELMQQALDTMEAAIKAGDWKVDGACDPDYVLEALRARLAQPKRAWQGMTDEDVKSVWSRLHYELSGNKFDDEPLLGSTVLFARAIEEKLRDKNGD